MRLLTLFCVLVAACLTGSATSASGPGIALVSAGATARGVSSATPSFGQPTSAGDLLVAYVASRGTLGGITVSDPSWVRASSYLGLVSIFYKPNSTAAEVAPTFSAGGASTIDAGLAEYSGVAMVSPLDQFGVDSVQELHMTTNAPDATSSDLVVVAVRAAAARNAPTTTAAFKESWGPSGGTSGTLGGSGAIRGTFWINGTFDLLNGVGGAGVDTDTVTVTLPKNSLGAAIGAIASFKPAA